MLRLKLANIYRPNFKVNRGLRQKDAIAPLLFNEVLGIAIRRPKVETWGPITVFVPCT